MNGEVMVTEKPLELNQLFPSGLKPDRDKKPYFVLCFDWLQGFVADATFAALSDNVKQITNICCVPGFGVPEQI